MPLSASNKEILDNAIKAVHERSFYSQYPEHPKAYDEREQQSGEDSFNQLLGSNFDRLMQEHPASYIGEEVSPFTSAHLNVKYPNFDLDTILVRAGRSFSSWRNTAVDDRANVLIDALEQIKHRFFEIAYATMHTTGQSFMMAFQASGPHANDRALEAIAVGYEELTRFPVEVSWEKPLGKMSVKLEKTFKPVPKGVSLVIGCSTFPIWNSAPGIFASLITGNSVIVKPHPQAVLPIAIFVAEVQKALKGNGFDPNTIQLAVDSTDNRITKVLAVHEMVKLVDYTGSSAFGNYIESLPGKTTFTEKAGVNSVILDSVSDINAVMQNLAFSVTLYSGQMCTTPQNFYIPQSGIDVGGSQMSYDDVVSSLKKNIAGVVEHPKMGSGTLGAIQNERTVKRAQSVTEIGATVLMEPIAVDNAEFEKARICAPTILEVEAKDVGIYENELFGPIILIIKTQDTEDSTRIAKDMAMKHGAITCAVYSTNDETIAKIQAEMESAFVSVSANFIKNIW